MWAAMERSWEKLPLNYRDCLEFRFDGRAEVIVRIESNFNIETGNVVPTELNFTATSIIIKQAQSFFIDHKSLFHNSFYRKTPEGPVFYVSRKLRRFETFST